MQIWTSRDESLREKTESWITKLTSPSPWTVEIPFELKMRPIGDTTPYHDLKEKWLDECEEKIEFVFEKDPESIKMWKRRSVFVFKCNQDE